jgi:serine phosphatase RsbU (regulator of sigma subunit)
VFVSVIVIEAIILIPSFQNRERELIEQLWKISMAKIDLIVQTAHLSVSAQELFAEIKLRLKDPNIIGGGLFRDDGTMLSSFGQVSGVIHRKASDGKLDFQRTADGTGYDLVSTPAWSQGDYTLVLRYDAEPVRRELFAFTLRIASLVIIISIFVTAGAWLALNPIVVKPILRLREDLIKAGETISRDQKAPEFYSVSVQRQDELGEVIRAFRQMFKQISEAVSKRKKAEAALQKSLRQVEAYSKALNGELEKGRQIQNNFLPARMLSKPGWEFAAYFKPARQVAGDFYDIFELPDHSVGLVIADVCDKGVGAALFMALFRSLIRIFSGQTALNGLACSYQEEIDSDAPIRLSHDLANPSHQNALKAVRLTNRYIAQNHEELAMFATLFFGVLDPDSGTLTYINGGHEPLLIIGRSGGIRKELKPTGPAVGIQPESIFEISEIQLEPGELLLGYTDGIIEARSDEDKFFGSKKLRSILQQPASSATELSDKISTAVMNHTGNAEQFDDLTLLAIRRLLRQDDNVVLH